MTTKKKDPSDPGAARPKTKPEITAALVAATKLTRKEVVLVLAAAEALLHEELKSGPGKFNILGASFSLKVKPAREAGTRPNPFRKSEQIEIKARPATRVVRVRALKALNDAVA
jgi:DNA-binding protein HU-beta